MKKLKGISRLAASLIVGIIVVGVVELTHRLGDKLPGGSWGRSILAGAIVGFLALFFFSISGKTNRP